MRTNFDDYKTHRVEAPTCRTPNKRLVTWDDNELDCKRCRNIVINEYRKSIQSLRRKLYNQIDRWNKSDIRKNNP